MHPAYYSASDPESQSSTQRDDHERSDGERVILNPVDNTGLSLLFSDIASLPYDARIHSREESPKGLHRIPFQCPVHHASFISASSSTTSPIQHTSTHGHRPQTVSPVQSQVSTATTQEMSHEPIVSSALSTSDSYSPDKAEASDSRLPPTGNGVNITGLQEAIKKRSDLNAGACKSFSPSYAPSAPQKSMALTSSRSDTSYELPASPLGPFGNDGLL